MTRDDALTGRSERFLYARAHGESYRRTGSFRHDAASRQPGPSVALEQARLAKRALEIFKKFPRATHAAHDPPRVVPDSIRGSPGGRPGWWACDRMTPSARPASPAVVEAEYLTPADVATLLQVSLKSVYRWVAQEPSMPAIWLGRPGGPRKHGGTLRFPRQRLLLWLRSKEQSQPRPRFSKLRRGTPREHTQWAGEIPGCRTVHRTVGRGRRG